MDDFRKTDVNGARKLIKEKEAILVDVRDTDSYIASHAKSARHLTNDNIAEFINTVEPDCPIVVMCYHGVRSRGVAQYLANQGYQEVYSIDGGFSEWQKAGLPLQSGVND